MDIKWEKGTKIDISQVGLLILDPTEEYLNPNINQNDEVICRINNIVKHFPKKNILVTYYSSEPGTYLYDIRNYKPNKGKKFVIEIEPNFKIKETTTENKISRGDRVLDYFSNLGVKAVLCCGATPQNAGIDFIRLSCDTYGEHKIWTGIIWDAISSNKDPRLHESAKDIISSFPGNQCIVNSNQISNVHFTL